MAIWYVDPLKTTAAGTGTFASPFGISNNTSMNSVVNNGDEIRIIGKDITSIATYNWTMKPYRINDGTTSLETSSPYCGLGLKVNSGTAYTGDYIIYCLELDMFCTMYYDSVNYTYYLGSGSNQLDYLLELNNLPLNTVLTFYAIGSSTYSYAQNRYFCCFTSTKSYLTITDNWTSATTRSTGVNKIMSMLLWGHNSNQYYTYMFQNVTYSTIDCSNTVYFSNVLQRGNNDSIMLGPISNSTITFKNISHSSPANNTSQTFISFFGTCVDINLNMKYYCPCRAGLVKDYNGTRIDLPTSGDISNFINITIDHIFTSSDPQFCIISEHKQNITYTFKNIVLHYSSALYDNALDTGYYTCIGAKEIGYSNTNTKTILNIGRIYISTTNYKYNPNQTYQKYYIFDSYVKYLLSSKLLELNLLSNFDVTFSLLSLGIKTPYYTSGLPLYSPECRIGSLDLTTNLFTTNLSSKTNFIESLNTSVFYIKNTASYSNSLVEYDYQKSNNSPLRLKYYTIISQTLNQAYPNFIGNFTMNDAIIVKNNNILSKFIPINSSDIQYTNVSITNVMKVEEDYITYKTISPSLSLYPFSNAKSLIAANGKSLFKHVLEVKSGKTYNLKFSLNTNYFETSELKISIMDDINTYPVTLSGDFKTKWETINFDNYVSSRDQFLTIVVEMTINNQKCKLTLSDIILTQLN